MKAASVPKEFVSLQGFMPASRKNLGPTWVHQPPNTALNRATRRRAKLDESVSSLVRRPSASSGQAADSPRLRSGQASRSLGTLRPDQQKR